MRIAYVVILCFAIIFALFPIIKAQPTHLWTYEKYGGYIRLPAFSIPNGQVTYENKTEGFEFNVTLTKKPAGSSLKINIESEGWDWYYQPPLNQEVNVSQYTFVNATHVMNGTKILIYRPENIVGSYAVYGNSKYSETGKVLHLYRPLLIAADGGRSWGNLNVSQGILTISVNATWLNNAVYPVVIDPTFGYTSVGGTNDWLNANYLHGTKFTCSYDGDIDTTFLYTNVGGSANVKMAVYDDSDDSLLGTSQELTSMDTTTWNEFTFASHIAVNNGDVYWLMWISDTGIDQGLRYDSGDTGQTGIVARNYALGFPDPLPSLTTGAQKFSVYASGEEGGDTYTSINSISNPTNITYTTQSVSWSVSNTGNDTGYAYQIALFNGTSQVGTNTTSASGSWTLANGTSYKFCVSSLGDNSSYDYDEIMFSVAYNDAIHYATENYVWMAVLLVAGFVFLGFMLLKRDN